MFGLFKRKLAIQKRAQERKIHKKEDKQNKQDNEYFDDYYEETYENRNIFFDVVGFLCILFSGILLLSYLSMNMEDLNSGREITNLLGIFGAYISTYSFLAFGFASYIIPAFFMYAGVNIILKNCRFILSEVTDDYRVYNCADCHRSIKVPIDKPNIEDMVEKCQIIKSYIDSMVLQMSSLTSGEYFDSNMMSELSITMSVLDELPKIYSDIHEKFHKHR